MLIKRINTKSIHVVMYLQLAQSYKNMIANIANNLDGIFKCTTLDPIIL